MSLFWLPPAVWFTVTGGILLVFVLSSDTRLPVGVASFCVLLAVLSWPVQQEIQRIYSPYQLLERMSKSDGRMNLLSGGAYYQKVFDLAESDRGNKSEEIRYVRAYYEFPFNLRKSRSASPLSARAAVTTWRRHSAWVHHTSMRSKLTPPLLISASTITPRSL